MKKSLKLFLSLLMLCCISAGSVWANKTIVFTVGNSDSGTTAASINTSSSDDVATLSSSYCYARTSGMWISSSNNAGTATLTMKEAGQVKASKIVTTLAGTMSGAISIQVTYTDNSTSTKTSLGTATGDTAYALDPTKTIKSIQYTAAKKAKASISQLIIHEASTSTNPTVFCEPVFGPFWPFWTNLAPRNRSPLTLISFSVS